MGLPDRYGHEPRYKIAIISEVSVVSGEVYFEMLAQKREETLIYIVIASIKALRAAVG